MANYPPLRITVQVVDAEPNRIEPACEYERVQLGTELRFATLFRYLL
jgi:hypothetical protein